MTVVKQTWCHHAHKATKTPHSRRTRTAQADGTASQQPPGTAPENRGGYRPHKYVLSTAMCFDVSKMAPKAVKTRPTVLTMFRVKTVQTKIG